MKRNKFQTRYVLAVGAAAATLALVACGGGGGGGGFPVGGLPTGGGGSPAADGPIDGFIAYVRSLVATAPESTEPVDVARFDPPPVSDSREPVKTD